MNKANINLYIRSAKKEGPCVCCDKEAIENVLVMDFGEDERTIICQSCADVLESKLLRIKVKEWEGS